MPFPADFSIPLQIHISNVYRGRGASRCPFFANISPLHIGAVKRVCFCARARVCDCLVRPDNESCILLSLHYTPRSKNLHLSSSVASLSAAGPQPTGLVRCCSKSRIIFLMKVVFDNGIFKQRRRFFSLVRPPFSDEPV